MSCATVTEKMLVEVMDEVKYTHQQLAVFLFEACQTLFGVIGCSFLPRWGGKGGTRYQARPLSLPLVTLKAGRKEGFSQSPWLY